MILESILQALSQGGKTQIETPKREFSESVGWETSTKAGQRVSAESSKNVATIYRAANIISDDIAKLPFQTFISRQTGEIERVQSDYMLRNHAYLNEVAPNRWMTPFIFKKAVALWLFFWGNSYIWSPLVLPRERFILPANLTTPVFDANTGELWYEVRFPEAPGKPKYIPSVEILHLMMNSSDGYVGKSMITYARETIGRRMAQGQTMSSMQGQGLTAAGIVWVKGEANKEIRAKIREAYSEGITGSENAGNLAVFDSKFEKYEPITMKATDAQFLESAEFTDTDLANFANIPLHKLNKGKQSYESNIQQQLDYLSTTLDPYLVQLEQGAGLKWLRADEQPYTYFRFERNALLRMSPRDRAEYLDKKIMSGQMSPNEARQVEDMPAYENGDKHYIPANMVEIGAPPPEPAPMFERVEQTETEDGETDDQEA